MTSDQTTDPAPGDLQVRRARLDDARSISAVIARAFEDDPLMRWVLPDDVTRRARMDAAGVRLARVTIPYRYVLTTTPVMGSAFWAPPGKLRIPRMRMARALPDLVIHYGPSALRRSSVAFSVLGKKHPREPHWYLEGLSTDPPFQRRGIGSALVQPVLQICDGDGVPAYLETQTEANVPYYRRHGFEVVEELDLPDGGPHMWLMWREPGSA